jgi:NADP-dependent 3-hydroxy acid dehydrogenase YdfG
VSLELAGRVVAVTGASSGIGKATALACAHAGAAVALAARREDRIDGLAAEIAAAGGRAIAVRTDVTDESESRRFVERTTEAFGRLDALINSAGMMTLGPADGANTDDWRRTIAVNVFGVLYCIHSALPVMRRQGGGDIVNLSAIGGRTALPGVGIYCLTKFGIGAFSESLRQEVAPLGIRVTLIEPGFVESTEIFRENSQALQDEMRARLNVPQPLEPKDVADAVVYAISRPSHVAVNEMLVRPAAQVV